MMNHKSLFLFLVAYWVSCFSYIQAKEYKIALIHSYQHKYTLSDQINLLLRDELKNNGLDFQLKEYFLDCERHESQDEEKRMFHFMASCQQWGADLIAVLDDQATYSLMACNHPLVRQIPVVFSGVNYPNMEMLSLYPTISGHVDKPDYLATCQMIERIMGKVRINLLNDNTILDKMIWNDLLTQCKDEKIEIEEWKRNYRIDSLMSISDTDRNFTSIKSKLTEYTHLDTTVIVRLPGGSVAARDLLWLASGMFKYSLFLYTKRDYTTLRIGSLFDNPGFETINEGFGGKDYMLGGYFATIETQMSDMAAEISTRLKGKSPVKQVKYNAKEYVVNWKVLHKYNIPIESIPTEYTIMYMPFSVKYHSLLIALASIVILIAIAGVLRLIYMYMCEKKKKKDALTNLRFEHESLSLALEGGDTYAWRFDGRKAMFDTQFYDLIQRPHTDMAVEEITKYVHPSEQETFFKNVGNILKQPRRIAQYHCNFDGKGYQWWEFRYSVITYYEKSPIVSGLLVNIQDIKDKEEELINSRKLAEQAELKQSFLTNMSHEIRTPLNAIVGFSNLLTSEESLSDEEKKEFATIINNNTNLLLKLINDILELSRIDSGNLSFNNEECSVRELLESLFQTHQVLIKPHLTFAKVFDNKDVTIRIDSMRLTQVITNFLNNANKFTQEGSITLGYLYKEATNEVHIYVEDTGSGIPKEEVKMIFERFYKRNEFAQGVGLGLSISQVMIEKMNGAILVDSEIEQGSRFTIVLPCI